MNPQNKPEQLADARLRHGFARLVRYDDRLSFQVVRSEKMTDSEGKEVIDKQTNKPKRVYTQVYLDPSDLPILAMIAERYHAEQKKMIMGGGA